MTAGLHTERPKSSPAASWVRALARTAPIAGQPSRTLPVVLAELAERSGDALAVLAEAECFTFAELLRRANQYARWALDRNLAKGEVVALLMPNRPEYMAIWLGITSVGGTVALLNTNLTGAALGHSVNVVAPRLMIVDGSLSDRIGVVNESRQLEVWMHGASSRADQHRLDSHLERYSGETLDESERRGTTIDDPALYIYTSGTTGLPKAAMVGHGRLMQWTHWFAGMMDAKPGDRMYNCLPMYHSVGGVLATGAVLVGGGSVVVRESFSARRFWRDVVENDCTLFQYVGELCRYLMKAAPTPDESAHRLRLACGNGLGADVWEPFARRFQIPAILEFYASTEGNVSLFNAEGKPGAVGRIPGFLRHRFPAALVKFDVAREEPFRDQKGRCVACGPQEAGELLGPVDDRQQTNIGARYEGYTSANATEKKILRDVFEPGDAWFRTGDLMRMDENGFFYFVDRVGDTFRWKGENVSTTEVSEAIRAFPGISEAIVYGVGVPGTDGRAGMAAIVADDDLDLHALRGHLVERLPPYARPVFLRLRPAMDVTATFKYSKVDLARDAFDPASTSDPIYLDDTAADAFVTVDTQVYDTIQRGELRF